MGWRVAPGRVVELAQRVNVAVAPPTAGPARSPTWRGPDMTPPPPPTKPKTFYPWACHRPLFSADQFGRSANHPPRRELAVESLQTIRRPASRRPGGADCPHAARPRGMIWRRRGAVLLPSQAGGHLRPWPSPLRLHYVHVHAWLHVTACRCRVASCSG